MLDYLPKDLLAEINKYLSANADNNFCLSEEDRITDYWYKTDEQDLSLYYNIAYLYVGYNCYKRFSRNYVKLAYSVLKEEGLNSILDYGAGIGATSLLSNRLFNIPVYYQNLKGIQLEFAKIICQNNVSFIESESELKQVDLIFCLELFEHVKEPIMLLEKLHDLKPKFFVISNSFNVLNYGHYTKFSVNNLTIDKKKMPRFFNKNMLDLGYVIDDRSKDFWNSRPVIWRRND